MSESTSNSGRLSRRKPLKTTRILAQIDDETTTSGNEAYYISDTVTGLPDTLISDYELRDTEHDDERSVSPLQTERVDSDHHIAATAAAVVISSSYSENVQVPALSHSSSRRGRPHRTQPHWCRVNEVASQLLSVDEYNIGPVLERLLAMMQSMTMLLSALKNDLRHTGSMPEVVARKRDAATMQLWRAFVAYHKSFAEIEEFASSSKTSGQQTAKKSLDFPVINLPSQSHANQNVRAVSTKRRPERFGADVIEVLSESEDEDGDDVVCKRARYDVPETVEQSEPIPVSSCSSAAVELATDTSVVASSSESSLAQVSVTPVDASSDDTSASFVCVDAPTDTKPSDSDASEPPLLANSERLSDVESIEA